MVYSTHFEFCKNLRIYICKFYIKTYPLFDYNYTWIILDSFIILYFILMTKKEFLMKFKQQKTFVMIKPDGVQRGLIGEILQHFEKKVMKVVAMKMIQATEEQARAHYPMEDSAWIARLWWKSLSWFDWLGINPVDFLGTDDPYQIWQKVAESLVDYFMSWPSVLLVLEWIQAVDIVRKIVGNTLPSKADMGTIRADYSIDTPLVANVEARAIHNMIHASETEEEAQQEIKLWFGDAKLLEYERAEEKVAYAPDQRLNLGW